MSSPSRFVSDLSGLSAIHERGVQVVVAQRKLPRVLQLPEAALAAIGPFEAHADRAIRPSPGSRREAESDAALFGVFEDGPFARALRRDVEGLVGRFGALTGRDPVHVSLEVLGHDACRKWHSDRVGLRLLVTYVGPGTEWALPEGVDRSGLGQTDLELEAANDRIVFDRTAIRRANAGDVLLCKGDLHPGAEGQGLVHRSPPIRADARWRLLVRIDERGCGA